MHKGIEVISIIVSGTIILLSLAILVIVFTVRHRQNIYKHKNQLLQSQLEIQEQTFNAISQEIHDNVGQILSVVNLQLSIIDRNKNFDDVTLQEVQESVSKAIRDLRDIAKSLNTDRIRFSGLAETTKLELDRINRSGVIQTSLHIFGTEKNIHDEKKLIIFRIIQEALHNILKHSGATRADVIFHFNATNLKVDIADNGAGFDTKLQAIKDGLGLHNMIKRAEMIGGRVAIESSPGKGTEITIVSPYF
jgi:signal transduction histidine kinase